MITGHITSTACKLLRVDRSYSSLVTGTQTMLIMKTLSLQSLKVGLILSSKAAKHR